ncbi:hypothetical protein LYNGBM3L_43140 [Moorena producens 3L]|uniref:Uncharacterized protein n=1 Tax=Moorena producens 3L TaxID=489825 RepID=F4XWD0_9CYAN|nr:hypothetical protein LYNGBM3L_43140 [Moorena producens 3L]OLT66195.1 hypothetical protein BI334_15235 [Moorena producens 3L]
MISKTSYSSVIRRSLPITNYQLPITKREDLLVAAIIRIGIKILAVALKEALVMHNYDILVKGVYVKFCYKNCHSGVKYGIEAE